ncbi:hypothetical protein, partial [Mesorhizobium sp. M7D.F.Ca.US.004.03.1.1]|uniref:hypothetical protein n=1 Tax=Mesorhizobium sp. M7D.F.Ca.US.004.03.1.1 TaxID=2496702 RepID=UPI0019D20464
PKSCSSLSIIIIAEPKAPFARYRQDSTSWRLDLPLAPDPINFAVGVSPIITCKTNEIYCRFSTNILHHNFDCDW